ncbi:hypothetical protein L3Q82_026844 [Scortum barcoo]|uniref:Uncharacterized protein n=1 Tax=Scortum barcoo TaxID=214431 RepID=A0ACB8WJ82_9TELE|nr:hypothetical protein L3Q82_026844 [Scortum barcoo]
MWEWDQEAQVGADHGSPLIKTTQQRMYFLWLLMKFSLPKTMMCTSISPSLCPSSPSPSPSGTLLLLPRTRQSAAYHWLCREGDWLQSSLQDLYSSRTLRCAGKIVGNPFHTEQTC